MKLWNLLCIIYLLLLWGSVTGRKFQPSNYLWVPPRALSAFHSPFFYVLHSYCLCCPLREKLTNIGMGRRAPRGLYFSVFIQAQCLNVCDKNRMQTSRRTHIFNAFSKSASSWICGNFDIVLFLLCKPSSLNTKCMSLLFVRCCKLRLA